MRASMDISPVPHEEAQHVFLYRAVCSFTGNMHLCKKWMKKRHVLIQLVDWVLRGMAQVMFVNNPVSGLIITVALFLQDPWWATNALLGTLVSTVSALALGQNREAISAGLYGLNGTLVGMLMAVFSVKGSWYWWLLIPNIFMSLMCPVLSSALSSIATKWDLPILTLPFNILIGVYIAATGAKHCYFPVVDISPNINPLNESIKTIEVSKLFLCIPLGVGQVYGCDSPWTGSLILLALLISSPIICLHATLGSAAGMLSGLALAAPHRDIYSGLCGYNSALCCIAIGGVFYVLTCQTHILCILSAFFCGYLTCAVSRLLSILALPACTWPFCLSTLIFLLISSEIPAICRLPLSVVSNPEENRRVWREALKKDRHAHESSSQQEVLLKEDSMPHGHLVLNNGCNESV